MSKNLWILMAGSLMLTGCMATTQNIQASKVTDSGMSCAEIAGEIDEMNTVIADVEAQDTQAQVAGVGTGVAGHAVSLGGVPLLGAAISHAGGIANMSAGQRAELKQDAEMRMSTLNGLYVGKGCATGS